MARNALRTRIDPRTRSDKMKARARADMLCLETTSSIPGSRRPLLLTVSVSVSFLFLLCAQPAAALRPLSPPALPPSSARRARIRSRPRPLRFPARAHLYVYPSTSALPPSSRPPRDSGRAVAGLPRQYICVIPPVDPHPVHHCTYASVPVPVPIPLPTLPVSSPPPSPLSIARVRFLTVNCFEPCFRFLLLLALLYFRFPAICAAYIFLIG